MCSRTFDLSVFPSMSRRPAAPFTRRYPLRLYLLSRRLLGSIDFNCPGGSSEPPYLEKTGALLFLVAAGVSPALRR